MAFETWAATRYDFDDADFKRDPCNDMQYRHVTLRIAWQAWLEARRKYIGQKRKEPKVCPAPPSA